MKFICIFLIFCISRTQGASSSNGKLELMSLTKPNTTKKWKLEVDINFTKSLPPVTKRKLGLDVKLKCEAMINFTRVAQNERITSLDDFPVEYKITLMNNVEVYWLKDNKQLSGKNKTKSVTKIHIANHTIDTALRIKNVDYNDEGNYSCVIKQSYEKRQNSRLIVVDDSTYDEIPTYESLFPDSLFTDSDANKGTTLVASNMRSEEEGKIMLRAMHSTELPKTLEPICQKYTGKACFQHLEGQYVYIPYTTSQALLEEKLIKALQVINFSNEISSHCEGYALPSLCYSTFPICRDPLVSNDNFLDIAKHVLEQVKYSKKSNINDADELVIEFENLPKDGLPKHLALNRNSNKNLTLDLLNYRYNSTVLKRVCKEDCEILENELCQPEYAIAKRHPHIGQTLTLEDCNDLPENDPECLKIVTVMVSDDECYWENGNTYLGRVNVADNGLSCIEWSKQMQVHASRYPELAGLHSYCRNPGGLNSQPWCFIDKDGEYVQQICDIPKCAHKIWVYIVIVFFILTLIIICFIFWVCFKNRRKNNGTTLMDINLPNADKNIYGNSRLNSPIEMSDLLTNQNINSLTGTMRNTRGNGILRIPQYSLSQIRFLEELGEGAFGKVYKGALTHGADNQYVAVKALKENASAKTQADFRREIDLISELRHDNIVCIVGVALREEPLCMLFEFMARGDLHEFLMGRAPPSGKGLPAIRLLNIVNNIASGMQYLASHHYVHRDLAARNCLVSDDFVVKISDFGLSRDIYSSDYYRVQSKSLLPVRWMPPESILYGKFTTESDIWSYGVVLWEIYSYGLQPYYGYSNQEVISMVRGGELLACPTGCPPAMYALMRDCWKHTPQRRPNFEDIVLRIQTWIDAGGCPEMAASDSSSACSHRQAGSSRDLQERVPLLPPHCSSSNGSLATGSLKKLSIAGSSSRMVDDNCSTCSEVPPKPKKGSCGSLIDNDKCGARETVVRIPNTQFGNDI